MQSKRGELVPVAEVVSRLGGPVAAIRDTSPQALHHFTQADQVNQLVSASEAEPDLGFMAPHDGAVLPATKQPDNQDHPPPFLRCTRCDKHPGARACGGE